jgi:hypothetical protein
MCILKKGRGRGVGRDIEIALRKPFPNLFALF